MLSVSVCLPVSNRPRLLGEALSSVLGQTYLPKEIIIVLNHSDPAVRRADYEALLVEGLWQGAIPSALPSELPKQKCLCVFLGTPKTPNSKKAGPPLSPTSKKSNSEENIKFVILQESQKIGPAAARNAGIRAAAEPWIAFLDSDDLWEPEKLKKQWEFLQKRPHLRACHTAERWLKHGKEIPQPLELRPRTGRFLVPSFRHCLISASSLLIERDLLLELGLFDESFPLCEDYELWLRLLAKYPVGLVPGPLTIKRSGHWPQLSRSAHSLDLHRTRALEKMIRSNALLESEKTAAEMELKRKRRIVETGRRKRSKL